MPRLHGSRRSPEENVRQKQAEERVWMEELEGRVMLSADVLDVSTPVEISGTGNASYQFKTVAGRSYRVLEWADDADAWIDDGSNYSPTLPTTDWPNRLVWTARTSGVASLVISGRDDYRVILREATDDFGDDAAHAAILTEDQPIHAEIGDVADQDWFKFEAQEGTRYAFDLDVKLGIWPTLWDQDGNRMWCSDGCRPMPYTGTYYIKTEGDRWNVGPYTLSARRVVDDNEGGVDGAKPLTIGSAASGSIDYSGDSDWFEFQAEAGKTYGFEALGSDGMLPLELYDQSGGSLAADYDSNSCCAGRMEWVAPADGIFFIEVKDYYYRTGYTLRSVEQQVENASEDGVAKPVGFGKLINGTIARPGESDYFSFYAAARGTYTLTLRSLSLAQGMLAGRIARNGVLVEDREFARLYHRNSDDPMETTGWSWTAPAAGVYYIWVRSWDPLGTGDYQIQLDQELDDHGNSPQEATPLAVAAPALGITQYDQDQDWFAMDVVEGTKYILDLTRLNRPDIHGHGEMAYLNDLTLSIVDGSGKEIVQASSMPRTGVRLEWQAPATGTFYAYLESEGLRVNYSLTLTTPPKDQNPPTYLALGETTTGQLTRAGEVRLVRVELEGGKRYAFNIGGQIAWSLVRADGSDRIWFFHQSGPRRFSFDIAQSGAYFIELYSDWWGGLLSYSVGVSENGAESGADPPEDEPANPVSPPRNDSDEPKRSGESSMELADEDDVRAFSVNAEAGQVYTFRTILGTLEDSTLTIYNSDGNVVDENDDVSDDDLSSMIEWTAQKSGIYFVVVGGFGGGSFDLAAFAGEGANRKKLDLSALAVADARSRFGYDSSSEEEDDESSDDGWLSDDYEELDFTDDANWGLDI